MPKLLRYGLAAVLLLAPATAAAAAGGGTGGSALEAVSGSLSGKAIGMVALLTVLSLAPGILMTVTSFTRIVVALSLLRTGLGAQGVPPNPVIISLALFLSMFVMTPTMEAAWTAGIKPYTEGKISEDVAFAKTAEPFRKFMMSQVRDDDIALFNGLAAQPAKTRAEVPLGTLIPAFMISELRRAFEIGFLLLLPFLVIDLAVSAVLMAMGMMMLPPTTIALPCKIIFFVLVDGWALVAGSLIRSFGTG